MTKNKKKEKNEISFTEMLGLPRARRSQAIKDLSGSLRGTHIRDTITVFGTRYTLCTLEPSEEQWVTTHIQGNTPLQIGRNQMAPYVAAALSKGAIDGKPTSDHFVVPDDLDDDVTELMQNKVIYEEWLRREVLDWLFDDSNSDLLQQLWTFHTGLVERQRKALQALDPLSKKTSSGESAPTSSPEKESLPQTQASNV